MLRPQEIEFYLFLEIALFSCELSRQLQTDGDLSPRKHVISNQLTTYFSLFFGLGQPRAPEECHTNPI